MHVVGSQQKRFAHGKDKLGVDRSTIGSNGIWRALIHCFTFGKGDGQASTCLALQPRVNRRKSTEEGPKGRMVVHCLDPLCKRCMVSGMEET